jgi:trans-aconitate methyltransferase
VTLSEGKKNHTKAEETPMASFADGTGPGAFDEAQAHAYAAATDIETALPHDHVFVEILRLHARGAALDLGGGSGRYAAWLLTKQLATSVHVIDNSPPMIDACVRRGCPGLTAQLEDIETADLGREQYDLVLARFVLMHIRALDATLQHIAMSLKATGTLVVVTNVIEGAPTAVATFVAATAGIMRLLLQAQGQAMAVSNYVRTPDAYTQAVRQAGLRLAFSETYAPKIVRFAHAHPGITLSHCVLVGKKEGE